MKRAHHKPGRRSMVWEVTCTCGWRYDGTRYLVVKGWAAHHRKEFGLSSYSPLYSGPHETTVRKVLTAPDANGTSTLE
jgi:hypothetical protein